MSLRTDGLNRMTLDISAENQNTQNLWKLCYSGKSFTSTMDLIKRLFAHFSMCFCSKHKHKPKYKEWLFFVCVYEPMWPIWYGSKASECGHSKSLMCWFKSSGLTSSLNVCKWSANEWSVDNTFAFYGSIRFLFFWKVFLFLESGSCISWRIALLISDCFDPLESGNHKAISLINPAEPGHNNGNTRQSESQHAKRDIEDTNG